MDAKKIEISLKEYLRLLSKKIKDPPQIDIYDEFLIKVWDFFSLRSAAEKFYETNKHLAYSKYGALPVTWQLLKDTWKTSGPPEQPITLIARRNYNDVYTLVTSLRKVLNRVRQKVPLSKVQQIDGHCLRWLTRQPGITPAEKGGFKQEILGVVRVENFDTLENRVLKDFLLRCIGLSTMYLRKYDVAQFKNHNTIKSVHRLKNLCLVCLSLEEFEIVRDLREFPQPNYVLQQDKIYSKIWHSYCDILRQEDVAEKLWKNRKEISETYKQCNDNIDLNCSSKTVYSNFLWINPLDGRNKVLEQPIYGNKLSHNDVVTPIYPEKDVVTINLTHPWDNRCTLAYFCNHKNARPYIVNHHSPSSEPSIAFTIDEILEQRDEVKLQDYFRQLYALVKGKRWIILVPDHWEPYWLELIIRATTSFFSRNNVFLLWRSVATSLGMMEDPNFEPNKYLIVADGYSKCSFNLVKIRFIQDPLSGRILPQRASTRLHAANVPNCSDVRFFLDCRIGEKIPEFKDRIINKKCVAIGNLNSDNFNNFNGSISFCNNDNLLEKGVARFLKEEANNEVSYFDERDALSLVVQTRSEEVLFKTLVSHDECSPGGRLYQGEREKGGTVLRGESKLSLYLHEGEHLDDVPLKEMVFELEQKTLETSDVFFKAEMTPGQGLARVLVSADILKKSIPLDLTNLEISDKSKTSIEREMKRHFPPIMPLVESSDDIWFAVYESIKKYVDNGTIPKQKKKNEEFRAAFAKAQPYWGTVRKDDKKAVRKYGISRYFDENTMSPIDKLKRENVFGNDESQRVPNDLRIDWYKLFKRLANDYLNGENVLRLIAWTYQYDLPDFEFIRDKFYKTYVKQQKNLKTMEITFCANNFAPNDTRVHDILEEIFKRIKNNKYGREELRLAYNLMQFHPEAFENIDTKLCTIVLKNLIDSYNSYRPFFKQKWTSDETKLAGYFLKCMLFILHRRRFDSYFFKQSEDWAPSDLLNEDLPASTPTQRDHEKTRKAFIDYVRGHGTIDGIPLGDGVSSEEED